MAELLFTDFNELINSITDYCSNKYLEKQELLNNNYFFIYKRNTYNINNVDDLIISADIPRDLLLRFRSVIDDTAWGIRIYNFKLTATTEQIKALSSQDGRNRFCKILNEYYKQHDI